MKTLVLNAGFEPMSVVSFKRAVVLVLTGRADVIVEDRTAMIRSASTAMHHPSVIVLNRYIRPPSRKVLPLSRRGVLRRDDFTCAYCRSRATTVDHVLPRSRGGGNSWENLVACCLECNARKGSRTPAEMGWALHVTPRAPRANRWYLKDIDEPAREWRPYLAMRPAA